MSDNPFFSILIVNYNGGEFLARCVESLQAQHYQTFEVIVVDNASVDDSLDQLPEWNKLTLIRNDENLGFAVACNMGAEVAKGEWLVCLNPDTVAQDNWLDKLLEGIADYPDADAFGSTQIMLDDQTVIDGVGDRYSIFGIYWRGRHGRPTFQLPWFDKEIFSPCAAAAAYRRSVYEKLGGMDPIYFCYGEDVDLGFRLQLEGHTVMQLRQAVVYHAASGISGRESDFTLFHGLRNQIWVFMKNMPTPLLILFLPGHLAWQCLTLALYASQGRLSQVWPAYQAAWRDRAPIMQARQTNQEKRKVSLWKLMQRFNWHPLGPFLRK